MIQEYYLHMFCGINGELDQNSGAGRLAIATLMAGYGLNATTKKDLQSRVDWVVTPGCFLGQKEMAPTDYYCRNFPEVKFAVSLVPFRKVNRTMNYQLDWSVLDHEEWDWKITSPVWINLAKIYWLGYFLFGRNVLPETAIATMRAKFSPRCDDSQDKRRNLKSPFVMQFLKNMGLPLHDVRPAHLFSNSQDDLARHLVFGSLTIGMNWSENIPGYYAMGAMVKDLVPAGTAFNQLTPHLAPFAEAQCGRFQNGLFPLLQPSYYPLAMGNPAIPSSPSRVPTNGRDMMPLLWCNNQRSPQEEANTHYVQVRGGEINAEYFSSNRQMWLTAALMWEYYLMLTGRTLFQIELLVEARRAQNWTVDDLKESLIYLSPCNAKNSSVAQIVRFHLERQNQV